MITCKLSLELRESELKEDLLSQLASVFGISFNQAEKDLKGGKFLITHENQMENKT